MSKRHLTVLSMLVDEHALTNVEIVWRELSSLACAPAEAKMTSTQSESIAFYMLQVSISTLSDRINAAIGWVKA